MKGLREYDAGAVWGYALLLTLFSLFTGGVNPLFFGTNAQVVFPLYAHSAEVGQFCCLFALAVVARFAPRFFERVLSAALVAFLGTGFVSTLLVADADEVFMGASMAAGAFFGMGQGACFMGWLMVYVRRGSAWALASMARSTVLAAVLILILACLPSASLLFGLLGVIIVLGCTLTFRSLKAVDAPNDSAAPVAEGGERPEGLALQKSLVCLIAIAFACGAQRVVALDASLSQVSIGLLFPLGYLLGALLFGISWNAGNGTGGRRRVYPVLLAIMATCGAMGILPGIAVQTMLYAVVNIAFTVASMYMVALALEAAGRSSHHPAFVCGVLCGAVYFSIQLGRLICNGVYGLFGTPAVAIMAMSIIVVYVVAMAAINWGMGSRGGVQEHTSEMGAAVSDVAAIVPVSEEQIRRNPLYRTRYGLTDREIDIAVLALAGYNASEMSQRLGLSVNTIKTHLKNLYGKMGVHNRRELGEVFGAVEREG